MRRGWAAGEAAAGRLRPVDAKDAGLARNTGRGLVKPTKVIGDELFVTLAVVRGFGDA